MEAWWERSKVAHSLPAPTRLSPALPRCTDGGVVGEEQGGSLAAPGPTHPSLTPCLAAQVEAWWEKQVAALREQLGRVTEEAAADKARVGTLSDQLAAVQRDLQVRVCACVCERESERVRESERERERM